MTINVTKEELQEGAGQAMLVLRLLHEAGWRSTPALMTGLVMTAATGFRRPGYRWAVPTRAAWLTLCGAVWDEIEEADKRPGDTP